MFWLQDRMGSGAATEGVCDSTDNSANKCHVIIGLSSSGILVYSHSAAAHQLHLVSHPLTDTNLHRVPSYPPHPLRYLPSNNSTAN